MKTYLDYNATTPILPCALKAMTEALQTPHNASSPHSFGREGRRLIENARAALSRLINNPAEQIIFNSGATEGNNTIIQHFRKNYPAEAIIVSAIEHSAVLESDNNLTHAPVTKDGLINLNALEELLKTNKASLVSLMAINNETGAIQPIKEAAALAHKHGALFHTDATQALGRITIDMQEWEADFLTCSSHKIGGPQGIGALALRLCGETPTLLYGGGQEKSARAGTENVAGIVGFGTALTYTIENQDHNKDIKKLRNTLENGLKSITPNITIHSENIDRAYNTCFFSLPNASAETLMMAFDLEGIAISNGSACSSGTVKPSHVLKAMGVEDTLLSGALRISLGWNTTETDIDKTLKSWDKITKRLQK